jgi:predicted ABC-type ATPase
MPASKPLIYVIGGCNGAGKTTFAREFLPKEVKCLRFLNADELARGLSPFDPGAAAVKAARLLLKEFRSCVERQETFALESTLSGRTYVRLFHLAKATGYRLELHYLWLSSPIQAIARVRQRVRKGGHAVPSADIRRRFGRSLHHLVADYLPLADAWAVWDNRTPEPTILASSESHAIQEVSKLLRL